jgi:predicted nucleic acid-binding Zn ribbon protein
MDARLRARVIAEWRGLPETPFVRDTAKAVREPLAKLMQALGLGDRLSENEVKSAWREIVGEFLARHSAPDSIKDGVLIVRVLQPTLKFEFERNAKPQIVQKLRARFGAKIVRDVRFRLG